MSNDISRSNAHDVICESLLLIQKINHSVHIHTVSKSLHTVQIRRYMVLIQKLVTLYIHISKSLHTVHMYRYSLYAHGIFILLIYVHRRSFLYMYA